MILLGDVRARQIELNGKGGSSQPVQPGEQISTPRNPCSAQLAASAHQPPARPPFLWRYIATIHSFVGTPLFRNSPFFFYRSCRKRLVRAPLIYKGERQSLVHCADLHE